MPDFTYPYERAAMHGEEMPDGLDMVDQLNFLCLRKIYAQYRAGVIDRETGSREKKKLRYQYDRWRQRLMFHEKLSQSSAKMFKDAEEAATAYAKERTLENGDKMYQALYGMEVQT